MGFTRFLALICLINFRHILKAENLDSQQSALETYIVHVDQGKMDDLDSFLPTSATLSTSEQRVLHRYRNVFSGFAAKLSADEVKAMEQKDGFISAAPQRMFQLHTTHSLKFLGLNKDMGFWKESNYGKGVIIGMLDGGIIPDHPSFSDEGMAPPPAKWKGKCEFKSRACNNKLIGARYCLQGNGIPLDDDGHGSHTASTAAGNFVEGVSFFGNANGTAAGIAPLAHVAMYKVCYLESCGESDILAGMDAAIDDGVDILSLSLGTYSARFYRDNIAIAAYRAMEKGIFVSCSAGNRGPYRQTLQNEAPWILTVGASTIDRKIKATVLLGNNEEVDGESAFQPKDFPTTKLRLVFRSCNDKTSYQDYKGKIVLCGPPTFFEDYTRAIAGDVVKSKGGAAMILPSQEFQGDTTFAEVDVLPATQISYANFLKIRDYLFSTSDPTATILFKGTITGDDHAPVVAYFSSRGPNFQSPGILKPDIIGPGVNILAAWNTSVENKTDTRSNFNIISGTSMSCPHLSGVAALLKSAHPDWSPAAIKSAIVTTADQENLGGNPIEDEKLLPADVFAIGAGHVNPSKANDPGLIYDIQPDEYIPYLCGLNYTNQQVSNIVQRVVQCSEEMSIPEAQLNYPSFSIKLGSTPQTYTRTVTNVGEPNSSYHVEVVSLAAVIINVKPPKLSFTQVGQKLRYSVTFSRSTAGVKSDFAQGSINWISTKHSVRSPIVVAFG